MTSTEEKVHEEMAAAALLEEEIEFLQQQEKLLNREDEIRKARDASREETRDLQNYSAGFCGQLGVGFVASGTITVAAQLALKPEAVTEGLILAAICIVLGVGCYYAGRYQIKGRD